MGTRSRIGVMHGDKCKSIYCHWDGYLAHNGAILQEHYDSARANNLVALGDMSSLDKLIGEAHPFSQYHTKNDELSDEENARIEAENKAAYEAARAAGWSTFYGRDRGETGVDFRVSHTFDEFLELCEYTGAEYYYVMKDGVWYCGDVYDTDTGRSSISRKLTVLTEALANEKELA